MKKRIRSGLKVIIIFMAMLLIFPQACCYIYHFINPEFVIGEGGNRIEEHYMGKNVLIEYKGIYKNIDVEEYVAGIMAGVIPADYEMEALKTQAVLVRTNVLKEMEEKGSNNAADLSYEYLTKEDREKMWGRKNYDNYEGRIEAAVVKTSGKVIKQENNLIMALYHEVSIGKTASAAEVLGEEIAYLQSVDSSSDVEAVNYMNIYELSYEDIEKRKQEYDNEIAGEAVVSRDTVDDGKTAGEVEEGGGEGEEGEVKTGSEVSGGEDTGEKKADGGEGAGEGTVAGGESAAGEAKSGSDLSSGSLSIEESTDNGFVKSCLVSGTSYSGEQMRDMLDLPSTNFYVEEREGGVRIICLGKGSCLGVSQFGANCMAAKGSSMEDIIAHYYNDVNIESISGN